jgi:hypothetical protein
MARLRREMYRRMVGDGGQPLDMVEFAALPLHAGQPSPATGWSTAVRPPAAITAMATKIHGIGNYIRQSAADQAAA